QASHAASVFLIPSDVGKLFAYPLESLTFSSSPERLGQPCHISSRYWADSLPACGFACCCFSRIGSFKSF
ncbi:hypothetical protein KUCAC02_001756, partial [Chaenocephalus aceratus]